MVVRSLSILKSGIYKPVSKVPYHFPFTIMNDEYFLMLRELYAVVSDDQIRHTGATI